MSKDSKLTPMPDNFSQFKEVPVRAEDTVRVKVHDFRLKTGIIYSGTSVQDAIEVYQQARAVRLGKEFGVYYRAMDGSGWLRYDDYYYDDYVAYTQAWNSGKLAAAFARDYANDEILKGNEEGAEEWHKIAESLKEMERCTDEKTGDEKG